MPTMDNHGPIVSGPGMTSSKRLNLLILGGTSEANLLAARIAADPRYKAVLSLAGRTASPKLPPIPTRIGGFGGAAGLSHYIEMNSVHVLIDATHPFAEQISGNAAAAAAETRCPLIVLERPPWTPQEGDRWAPVPDLAAAARALPADPARVFLTVGRQSLAPFAAAPQHFYLIRVIDPPDVPGEITQYEIVADRGPFDADSERALMSAHSVSVLVTKNSGGPAAGTKLRVARELGIPVIMVARPRPRGRTALSSVDDVMDALARHHASLANRSE